MRPSNQLQHAAEEFLYLLLALALDHQFVLLRQQFLLRLRQADGLLLKLERLLEAFVQQLRVRRLRCKISKLIATMGST